MTPNTQSVTTETLLEIAADPQRQMVLRHLQGTGECGIEELIELIAHGGETTIGHRPTRDATSAVELHHSHLPRLADAGIVEYDRTTGQVQYHGNDRLEALLRVLSTYQE